jgi:hypothetical protein
MGFRLRAAVPIFLAAVVSSISAAQTKPAAPETPSPAAQPVPRDVLHVFSDAVEALVNDNPSGFMDLFDPKMPGYSVLREEIEGLLNANDVSATIDIVSDEGDESKRLLELDWLLVIGEKNSSSAMASSGKSWPSSR